jgi:hypothetical protein
MGYVVLKQLTSKSKQLEPNKKKGANYWKNAIYCHYWFDQIPSKQIGWWHYPYVKSDLPWIFLIDTDAMQDLYFKACDRMNGGECIDDSESRLLSSTSKAKKNKVNIFPLQNHILETLTYRFNLPCSDLTKLALRTDRAKVSDYSIAYKNEFNRELDLTKKDDLIWLLDFYEKESFIQSHEVLFPKIPLKYIKHILVYKSDFSKEIRGNIKIVFESLGILYKEILKQEEYESSHPKKQYIRDYIYPILKKLK